jgi:hypothetical protein
MRTEVDALWLWLSTVFRMSTHFIRGFCLFEEELCHLSDDPPDGQRDMWKHHEIRPAHTALKRSSYVAFPS